MFAPKAPNSFCANCALAVPGDESTLLHRMRYIEVKEEQMSMISGGGSTFWTLSPDMIYLINILIGVGSKFEV